MVCGISSTPASLWCSGIFFFFECVWYVSSRGGLKLISCLSYSSFLVGFPPFSFWFMMFIAPSLLVRSCLFGLPARAHKVTSFLCAFLVKKPRGKGWAMRSATWDLWRVRLTGREGSSFLNRGKKNNKS